MTTEPRGIRNNNPGNIRWSESINWKGQAGKDQDGFVVFIAPEDGIAAAAKNIQAYREKHELVTVKDIIERWAPPSENDTGGYVKSMGILTDWPEDRVVDCYAYPDMHLLLRAMARIENGKNPATDDGSWYDANIWERGLRQAGLSPSKSLAESRTTKGVGTGIASTAAAVGVLTDAFGVPDEIAGLLPAALAGLSEQTTAVILLCIGIAGGVYAFWSRRDDKLQGRL